MGARRAKAGPQNGPGGPNKNVRWFFVLFGPLGPQNTNEHTLNSKIERLLILSHLGPHYIVLTWVLITADICMPSPQARERRYAEDAANCIS